MSLITQLVRNYNGFKIDIPRWEIADQGVTALSGPSGSGKTSVIRLLLGLEPCPNLSWTLGDVNLAALPVEQRRLGVVFQSYDLFPHLSARENILFAAQARKIQGVDARLKELFMDLKLQSCLDRTAHLLSGGEKQRVALARALIGEPRFLFLDEPFSSLDVQLRAEARALVKKIIGKFKIPTLLVTHDPEDIKDLAHTVVKIADGQLLPG